jgi:peroxiredoxin
MKRSLLVLLALALPATPAGAQDAATVAKDTLANLAAEEAKSPRGRLELTVTDRRGEKKGIETDSEERKRIGALPGGSAQGTLVFGPDSWCKDLNIAKTGPDTKPMRVRTAESSGVLRNLMQVADGSKDPAYGRVIKITTTAPADAALTHRAAKSLTGVTWTSARPDGETVVLEGKRGEEVHTLTLALKPAPRVKSWRLSRSVVAPDGRIIEQAYDCRVETADDGSPKRVEEWMTVGSPINSAALRVTEIKKWDSGADLKPEDLQLRFPKGTHVVDTRAGVPAEYDQTSEGVNEEEVAEVARAFAEGRTKVGDPAPDFQLKSPDGKVTRLEELRGNIVLLYWFNLNSRPSVDSAGSLKDLDDRFRKQGVKVLALDLGDAGDPDGIEAFKKRFKWTFPVLTDAGGEAMRRYGLIAGIPKIAVVGKDGKLLYVQPGAKIEEVSALLDKLVAGN